MPTQIVPVFKNIIKNLANNILAPVEIKMLDLLSWKYDLQMTLFCAESHKFYLVSFEDTLFYRLSSLDETTLHNEKTIFFTPIIFKALFRNQRHIVFCDLIYPIETLYTNPSLYPSNLDKINDIDPLASCYFQSDRILSYFIGLNSHNPDFINQCILEMPTWIPKTPGASLREIYHQKLEYLTSSDTFVIIWGGGIYDWYSPEILIETVHQLATNGYKIKLIFPVLNQFNNLQSEASARAMQMMHHLDPNHEVFDVISNTWLSPEAFHTLLLHSNLAITMVKENQIEDFFAVRNRYRSFLTTFTIHLSNAADIRNNSSALSRNTLYETIENYINDASLLIDQTGKLFEDVFAYTSDPLFMPNIKAPISQNYTKKHLPTLDYQTIFTKLTSIPLQLLHIDNIMIFGAGNVAKILIPLLSEKIIRVVDNDSRKHGTVIHSFIIETVETLNDQTATILVTVLNRKKEIANQLKKSHNSLIFIEDLL